MKIMVAGAGAFGKEHLKTLTAMGGMTLAVAERHGAELDRVGKLFALDDSDADVRIFAVNILESLRHPQVEDWLLGVVENDAHVNVCAAAVDLLGEVGTRRAAPALQRLRQRFDSEPYIQFAAGVALKRLAGS